MPKSFDSETSISLETSPPLFIIRVKSWCFFSMPPLSVYVSSGLSQPPMWNHSTRYILKPHQTASLYACDCPNNRPSSPPLSSPVPPSQPHVRVLSSLKQPSSSSCSLASLTLFHHLLCPLSSFFLSYSLICPVLSPFFSLLLPPPEDFHLVFAAAPVAPNP